MANEIFDPKFVLLKNGEFFWHATTLSNVLKMIQYESGGLKPIGTGQLGEGFYVTSAISDYQKGMARRARPEPIEGVAEPPLFLFKVGVRHFYQLRPKFLTSWNPTKDENTDFFAVCWYKYGQGSVGAKESAGFIPPKDPAKGREFKYGDYQQETMFGTPFANIPKKNPKDPSNEIQLKFMNTLWKYTCTNTFPGDSSPDLEIFERVPPFNFIFRWIRPRSVFKYIFLELAFKTEECLKKSRIMAMKVFSPTIKPINLKFNFNEKSYDLTKALLPGTSLRTEENSLNFHEEISLDLDAVINALK